MDWQKPKEYWGRFCAFLPNVINRLSTFVLSIALLLLLPAFPIFIEWVRLVGGPKVETYLVTAAVFAGSFGVTAEHNFYRAVYAILFVVTLVLYTIAVGGTVTLLDPWAANLLIAVAALHAAERFWWHVVFNRPFPR